MFKKAILTFFLFSIVYSFFIQGDSYLSLGNDASVIGLRSYKHVYQENYINDPILSNPSFYYPPLHLMIIRILLKATDSYVFTLKIILFFQVFLSLITNYILIHSLFGRLSFLKIISLSYLITIPFVMLPYGEFVGFKGIWSALARSSFGIFVPLLFLFYYKNQPINIHNRNVSNIIALCFFLGVLVNLHPPLGINMFVVFLLHWSFFRAKKNKDLQLMLLATIIFLATSASFVFPYLLQKLNNTQELLNIEYVKYFFNAKAPHIQTLWFYKLTFIPTSVVFLLVIAGFCRKLNENPNFKHVFHLLKTLFIVAYIVDLFGALIYARVSGMSNQIISLIIYPLIRTERFLFYLAQLLIVYFLVNGKKILAPIKKNTRNTVCK